MSKRKTLFVCIAILIIALGFGSGFVLGKSNTSLPNKMIVSNENLMYEGTLFTPVPSIAYCDHIGEVYAITDTKLQVFKIVGQDEKSFLCLIKNGEEYLYQSQKEVPLTLSAFKPDKMAMCDFSTINDKKIWITEQSNIKKILSEMNDNNIVESPRMITTLKQVVFMSSHFPGINLVFQFTQDTQGNCFITNTYSNITWKIGDELRNYIM